MLPTFMITGGNSLMRYDGWMDVFNFEQLELLYFLTLLLLL